MISRITLFSALLLLTFSTAQADDPRASMKHPTPEEMERIEQLGTPGENHKVLDQLAGKWTFNVKWWMDPDQPAQEWSGTAENAWILGGRFLQQKVSGESMGKMFEGIGFTGYDNIREEYTTIWMDNMGTGMMTGAARFDSQNKILSETGTFSCPMTGERDKEFRSKMNLKDKDHFSYEMFITGADGKEFRNMVIEYSRSS